MGVIDKIIKLTKQLYPTGRAFNYPDDGVMYKLHKALGQSETRAVDDMNSILYQVLPDNANFTTTDATRWEQRLGMVDGSSATLSDRKAAILRKINHPGDIPARQSHDYLQEQLQAAGFTVYVHENIPVVGIYGLGIQCGQVQCGQRQSGSAPYLNKAVNSVDEAVDANFITTDNFKSVFTIGGVVLGSSTTVPLARKDEFRQLILKLKPVQTEAYLRITYI